ncbi:MAG: metallophosphoesterase family protein [Elusimicrobiota bacterium]|jgi:predicted phosphodiesterase
MRVLIAGDAHGDLEGLARLVLRAYRRHGVTAAIQLGDFGFEPKVLERFRRSGGRFAVPVHAIDGNHDDHLWLDRQMRNGGTLSWRNEFNLHYHPRASAEVFGSSTVGFLGGALHVDRPQKLHHRSLTSNFVQRRQQRRASDLFNRVHPDLLVTHSCPAGIGVGMRSDEAFREGLALHVTGAGFDAGPQHDCGEPELSRLWEGLVLRPRAWVFGHFHVPHSAVVAGVQFACPGGLPEERKDRILLAWDTEARSLEVLADAGPKNC